MQNLHYETYPLLISKNFLSHLNELTKMSIKIYLSLSFLQKKRGGHFEASHSEISCNCFNDNKYNSDEFYIRTDEQQYYKGFKQLEALGLIKVHRRKTKNGGSYVNKYNVY